MRERRFYDLEEAIEAGVPPVQAVALDITRVLDQADEHNDLNPDIGVMVLMDWRDTLRRAAES